MANRERTIKRKSGLSQREEQRLKEKKQKDESSLATKISKVAIMIVFVTMVISLIYTIAIYN